MIPNNPKKYYSQFLKGHEGKLHFAAHSHHFWPDVTRQAQLQYWDDCARMSDEKWDYIFTHVFPKTQKHIAKILNLKDADQIVIAPNTHELSARILSLFIGKDQLTILTTTNEFHSWRRQFLRLSEISQVKIQQVDSNIFFENRRVFIENMKEALRKKPDVCFLSQVFFDSGLALKDDEILELVSTAHKESVFIIDGYHGFGAVPTDLSQLEGKVFYLGGGYKYAQAGEGVGFLVVPKGNWRPAYTGWFAEFANLNKPANAQVGYASNAMAFMGATQDPSGCYRMNAAWDFFEGQGISIQNIHEYVVSLQKKFIELLPTTFTQNYKLRPVFESDLTWHGHFLTFEAPSEESAETCQNDLKRLNILIDRRGKRLRFGFGLYQELKDVEHLTDLLGELAPPPQ